MKKLICSLMVATMLFSTVVSVSGASEINSAFSMDEDDSFSVEEHINQRDYSDYINEIRQIVIENGIELFFDKNGVNNASIKLLDNLFFFTEIPDFVVYDTIAYLVKNGVSRDTCINLWVSAGVPQFLVTDDGRIRAMNLLSYFCEKYGAVCVLASGDVISSDGRIYDFSGKEYNEYGATDEGNTYATASHFYSNRFKLNSNLVGDFGRPLSPYGIFILPDGIGFSCDNEYSTAIDLGEVKSMSNGGVEIKISDGEVILPNGLKVAPMKKPIDESVVKVIESGFSQLVFALVRYGHADGFVKCIMNCFPDIDEEGELEIYNDEESLKAFVLENFCCTSLDIAMQYIRKQNNILKNKKQI